jgi:hypothetical protein
VGGDVDAWLVPSGSFWSLQPAWDDALSRG